MMKRVLLSLLFLLLLGGVILTVGVVNQRRFEAQCRGRSWPGTFLPAPGGSVHVWCKGTGDPVVLLEASGLGNVMQYERVLDELALRATACAWDRPGMGLSPPTEAGTSAPDQGERILAALDAGGIKGPLVVVGASAGGLISLYLARRHPERVVGVVLVDALGPEAVTRFAEPFARLAASARQATWAARFGLMRAVNPMHLGDRDACLTYRPAVFAATAELLSNLPESARLVNLSPPLVETMPLVVLRHGRAGDLVAGAATFDEQVAIEPAWVALQEKLAAQSKRGRLVVIENSGHLIAAEQPMAIVQAVQEVIAAAPPAR